jgi:hypothetical protein
METKITPEQYEELIAKTQAEIADLRANGTSRMSKTGVKWALEVNRDRLKRLRASLALARICKG